MRGGEDQNQRDRVNQHQYIEDVSTVLTGASCVLAASMLGARNPIRSCFVSGIAALVTKSILDDILNPEKNVEKSFAITKGCVKGLVVANSIITGLGVAEIATASMPGGREFFRG